MKHKQIFLVVIGVIFWIFQSTGFAVNRPNIVFIFTDDHAYQAIGAYGSRINRTPNLDQLAAQGVRFENCYVCNSICAPSRAAILTGKHSHLNGVFTNRERFDGTQTTFPKLLREAGYQTAIIGKWHLKSDPTGFDFWEVLPGQGVYYNPAFLTPQGRTNYTGYTTDIITDLALDWLRGERNSDQPFMLMVQHKAPHRPWDPGPKHLNLYDGVSIPEPQTLFDDYKYRSSAAQVQEMTIAEHMNSRDLKLNFPGNLTEDQRRLWEDAYSDENEKFKQARLEGKELVRWKYQRYIKDYLRCIASVDDNVGRIMRFLEKSGLAEDTVVIYSSDQGFYLGEHGWFDKRWMYEQSLRMPFIVRWPGSARSGTVNRHLTQNIDFAPTFLDIAGVRIPEEMQGRSLLPLLKGKNPGDWRKSIYYHYYEYPGAHSVPKHYGVRTRQFKLIHYYELGEWELFDFLHDPDEMRNVYSEPEYQDKVKELKSELLRLQENYNQKNPEASHQERVQKLLKESASNVGLKLVYRMQKKTGSDPLIPEKQNIDPSAKTLTVGALCNPEAADGVLLAQGGESFGYSLFLQGGAPCFAVRTGGEIRQIAAGDRVASSRRALITGVVNSDGRLRLYVDGKMVASGEGLFIERKPADVLSIGGDTGSLVADGYGESNAFSGSMSDIRIYYGVLDKAGMDEWIREGK
ncbi:MAG: sulfatase-like hydrolase/transferase [Verrucomicrobia bacterium]|nr:sulfatase-like hydrolase/transferase [Verrucomicrobiota bacterium]MCF7708023.1 sulfatase-like hydrolase/transferase [Verrucomicrobiota bacterium]